MFLLWKWRHSMQFYLEMSLLAIRSHDTLLIMGRIEESIGDKVRREAEERVHNQVISGEISPEQEDMTAFHAGVDELKHLHSNYIHPDMSVTETERILNLPPEDRSPYVPGRGK